MFQPTNIPTLKKNLVWQIAQRDYKFGKGKHASLTKATYDAVGNKFRSLWGKEAGWAHSVLFTADLRAFSERLVAKVEVKDEIEFVKVEANGNVKTEVAEITDTIVKKKIKREPDADEREVLEVRETTVRRSKRARTSLK